MEIVQIAAARGTGPAKGDRVTLSTQEMLKRLTRERARSDRTGRSFSLVLFHADAADTAHQRALHHVTAHARLTDEVGWYDDAHFCALLAETGTDGATTFARRVCGTLADDGVHLRPSILVYPVTRPGLSNATRDDDSAPDHPGGGDGGTDQADARSRDPDRTPAPLIAEPVEVSFAQPLPWWKRLIDVTGAGLAILLFSPLILLAALAVRVSSPGPAIFTQERAGLGGRPFRMYKFRTMVKDAEQQRDILMPLNEQDGPAFKLTRDPRITRVGWWLRKTSIDELPQLWNVLKGDMTLVGPRPLPCRESDACQQWHRARLDVTPGLTCIWQVKGRCNTNFDRWVRMDLDYAQRRSLWMDLKLIAMTVPAVLLQRGAK